MKETQQKRSRDGCWTCRKRKKKCDSANTPCSTCVRMGLVCERQIRLIWEDDARRDGMRRRGPRPATIESTCREFGDEKYSCGSFTGDPQVALLRTSNPSLVRLLHVSSWPFELDPTDSALLNRYIGLFSRTYPAFSGPTNPFLSVLVPLSMQCRTVLDSVLALTAVQTWSNGSFLMEDAMLKLRQKALRGCRGLITAYSAGDENVIHLLATCVLLLLYEKLAGEGHDNWTPHLVFSARIIPPHFFSIVARQLDKAISRHPRNDAFRFIASLFFYNDLVRATSVQTATLSNFYYRNGLRLSDSKSQFYFPGLIARMSAGDLTLTGADIAAWSGRLDWMPSFALSPPQMTDEVNPSEAWSEPWIVAEMYRKAALIYRKQSLDRFNTNSTVFKPSGDEMNTEKLAACACQLLPMVPDGSAYETSLLWPIGIISRELSVDHEVEKQNILSKLRILENRFQMRHYGRIAQYLTNLWGQGDKNKEILFG